MDFMEKLREGTLADAIDKFASRLKTRKNATRVCVFITRSPSVGLRVRPSRQRRRQQTGRKAGTPWLWPPASLSETSSTTTTN